jgi:tetratricopeptide (TPR) repeat protein
MDCATARPVARLKNFLASPLKNGNAYVFRFGSGSGISFSRVANVQVRKTITIVCALVFAPAFSRETFAQSPYNLMNLFGGIMQSALAQAAIAEWRKIPPEELSCMKETLQQRGVSIQSLIQQGIAPFDVRLSDVRTNCQFEQKTGVGGSNTNARQPSRTELLGASESPYVVDGLALGAKVAFNSAVYREYECNPSDQFEGLSWCRRHTSEDGPRGALRSSYTLAHTQDGTVFYVNRELYPAYFNPGDINAEIQRLSARLGKPTQVVQLPSRFDHGHWNGVIAAWGDAAFESLDTSSRDLVAVGKSPRKGILLDFIGNLQESAQQNLPLFRIGGGAGFVWAAGFGPEGEGKLRFFAIDASRLHQIQQINPAPQASVSTDHPWEDCQSSDTDTRLKGCGIVIDAKGFGSRAKLADALDGRCRAYNEKQNYAQALVDCKAAIDANPRYPWAYANLATAYKHLDDFPQAASALDKALQLKINAIWPWLDRAEVFEADGKKQNALKAYQFALLIDPSNKSAIDGVNRLQGPHPVPIDHCIDNEPFTGADSQASDHILPQKTFDEASLTMLKRTIGTLSGYLTKLREKGTQYNELSSSAKLAAEKYREQLPQRSQEFRNLVSQMQKGLERSAAAQTGVDEISQQLTDERKRLALVQKDHGSRKVIKEFQTALLKLEAGR